MNFGIIAGQGRGFITRWTVAGDVAARTITLPLVNTRTEGALSYNCTVNWGDGATTTVTSYNDVNASHTYASNGTYNVEIKGICEGWSFHNTGDKLKIVAVVNWGNVGIHKGWKYLANGFNGCTNLTSLGIGSILASGTGMLSDGFYQMCYGCSSLTSIPNNLFKNHIAITTYAFFYIFYGCTSLTAIPNDLFRYNTLVSTAGFEGAFRACTSLAAIPASLFRYNTLLDGSAFGETFEGCTSLTAIPTDLFRYNTALSSGYAFASTFFYCSGLTAIPADLFRYNTLLTTSAFDSTFGYCTGLTTIPTDLFRYNTLVSSNGFNGTFRGCSSLLSVPNDLFRYNTQCTGFGVTFTGCTALQLSSAIFFQPGEETTRFLNNTIIFTNSFSRTVFTGIQGIAPTLWLCDFGETIILDVAPAVNWAAADIITGQTSGATAVVVSKVSTYVYKIKQHFGTFTLGETVGVTGVPAKLALQGATKPTFTGTPTSTGCFGGAGNSLTSLSNYSDIPASWK